MFIPDLDLDFLPIPDPGSRGQKGTVSATLLTYMDFHDNSVEHAHHGSNVEQMQDKRLK
jgi:hypothetical protein